MQLSKRLLAVAGLVTPGNRVADVGCDHAYIAIYLAERGISPHIIAMDVNQGPVDRARENIMKYGYEARIEVRRSDGLQKLNIDEADTILIAGMGGALMIRLLKEGMETAGKARELVLQPQSEISKVRDVLTENHFLIIKENMVREDGKYYVMMKAVPFGKVPDQSGFILTKAEHYHYGRQLLELRDPVLHAFLDRDLERCGNILKSLEAGRSGQAGIRRKELKDRMKLIRRGLGYYMKRQK